MQNITYKNNKDKEQSLKINNAIKAKEVRLIDEKGEMIGVVSLEKALEIASQSALDLVEINSENTPPICKIVDYGKYKYLQQKKTHEAKKKQKKVILKKLFMHLNIGIHDYEVKIKQATNYILENKTVEVTIELRGREMEYSEKAKELLTKFYAELGGEAFAKLNNQPKLEGRSVSINFAPLAVKTTV